MLLKISISSIYNDREAAIVDAPLLVFSQFFSTFWFEQRGAVVSVREVNVCRLCFCRTLRRKQTYQTEKEHLEEPMCGGGQEKGQRTHCTYQHADVWKWKINRKKKLVVLDAILSLFVITFSRTLLYVIIVCRIIRLCTNV